MNKPARRVGVLGGMGPEATLVFLGKFYALTRARPEQDRPPLLLDMDPSVPDRNRAWGNEGKSPGPALAAMGRRLASAGADFCVLPCITAHGFADDFEEASGLPLLRLPAIVADALATGRIGSVGLLATSTALEMQLFQSAFADHGIDAIMPDASDQDTLMRAIYAIKRGDEARAEVLAVAERLIRDGAEALLIGCTDISTLRLEKIGPHDVIDALDVLAEHTLAKAGYAPD